MKVFTVPCRKDCRLLKRGLAVLVLSEQIVRLNSLQPDTGFDLVASPGPIDVVVEGEEVAGGGVVGANVEACLGDLRRAVGCGAAADDDDADRLACDPSRHINGRGAGEEVAGARVAKACGVEKRRGEDMLLLNAGDLLAQTLVNQAERVLRGGVRRAVVYGVDGEEADLYR